MDDGSSLNTLETIFLIGIFAGLISLAAAIAVNNRLGSSERSPTGLLPPKSRVRAKATATFAAYCSVALSIGSCVGVFAVADYEEPNRRNSSARDECEFEGGSLKRWVSEDGSTIYETNPRAPGVNEVVVCAESGRPVSVNGSNLD
jgi:hypothetical protein